jgi:hypothetical protein
MHRQPASCASYPVAAACQVADECVSPPLAKVDQAVESLILALAKLDGLLAAVPPDGGVHASPPPRRVDREGVWSDGRDLAETVIELLAAVKTANANARQRYDAGGAGEFNSSAGGAGAGAAGAGAAGGVAGAAGGVADAATDDDVWIESIASAVSAASALVNRVISGAAPGGSATGADAGADVEGEVCTAQATTVRLMQSVESVRHSVFGAQIHSKSGGAYWITKPLPILEPGLQRVFQSRTYCDFWRLWPHL